MERMLVISLVCALLVVIGACATIRRIASLRRMMIARIIVVMIIAFGAWAVPLTPVQPALADSPTNPDMALPLTCSVYQGVPRNDFEREMAAGARDRAIGDWGHTYWSIIHYDNAYNMVDQGDSLRERAAMNMACGFLYKANLEEQLLHARKNRASATSSKIPPPPEDLAALSDPDIAKFKNADCDIAGQLVSFALHPEMGAWAENHGCSSVSLPGEISLKFTPQVSDGHAAATSAPATVTIRDMLGEVSGIEEIAWLMVGNQKQIIYLRDGYRPVQQVTFKLPAARMYSYTVREKTFFMAPTIVLDRSVDGTFLADGKTYNLEVNENRSQKVEMPSYPR